jgi:hypothetical protein
MSKADWIIFATSKAFVPTVINSAITAAIAPIIICKPPF